MENKQEEYVEIGHNEKFSDSGWLSMRSIGIIC